jgi:hypothetical protein
VGSTNRLALTPCGKKNARPDIDEQPFGIFKTINYSIFVGYIRTNRGIISQQTIKNQQDRTLSNL